MFQPLRFSWVAWVVVAAACGGSPPAGRTPSPSAASPAQASASAASTPPVGDAKPLYPPSFRTGIPALDPVIAAAETADGSKLASLVELHSAPCTHRTGGDVTLPPCEPGEVEGTTVQVFDAPGCQPNFLRGPGASVVVRRLAETPRALYGAYRPKGSDVTSILMGTGAPGGWVTFEVTGAGKLVGLSTNCGGQFIFDGPPSSDVVVPPLS